MPETLQQNNPDLEHIINPSSKSLDVIQGRYESLNENLPEMLKNHGAILGRDKFYGELQFLRSQLNILGEHLANSPESADRYRALQRQIREREIDFFQDGDFYAALTQYAASPDKDEQLFIAYWDKMTYEYGADQDDNTKKEIKQLWLAQEDLRLEYEEFSQSPNRIPMISGVKPAQEIDFDNPILKELGISSREDFGDKVKLKELILILQTGKYIDNPENIMELLGNFFNFNSESAAKEDESDEIGQNIVRNFNLQVYTAGNALSNYRILKEYIDNQQKIAELTKDYESSIKHLRNGAEIRDFHTSAIQVLKTITETGQGNLEKIKYHEPPEIDETDAPESISDIDSIILRIANFFGILDEFEVIEKEEITSNENSRQVIKIVFKVEGQQKTLILDSTNGGYGSSTSLIDSNTVYVRLDNPNLLTHESGHAFDALIQSVETPSIINWQNQAYARHEFIAMLSQLVGNKNNRNLNSDEVNEALIDFYLLREQWVFNYAKAAPYLLLLDMKEEYKRFADLYDKLKIPIVGNSSDNFDRLALFLPLLFQGYHNSGLEYSVGIKAARNMLIRVMKGEITPNEIYELMRQGSRFQRKLMEKLEADRVTPEDLGFETFN